MNPNRLISVVLVFLIAAVSFSRAATPVAATAPDVSRVPGVIIDYSPQASGLYLGSPSLAVLPGGAHNNHDANFLTFHRWKGFRALTMKDAPAGYGDGR